MQTIIKDYIYSQQSYKSRYEIDLELLRTGHTPYAIELAWKELAPLPALQIKDAAKAGYGQRWLASIWDSLICGIIIIAAFIPLVFLSALVSLCIGKFGGGYSSDPLDNAMVFMEPGLALGIIGIVVFYYTKGFINGQTWGSKRAGIRFVTASFTRPNLSKALLRVLLPVVFLLTICLLYRQLHIGWSYYNCVCLAPFIWFGRSRRNIWDRLCGLYTLKLNLYPNSSL